MLKNVDTIARRVAWLGPSAFYAIDVQAPVPEWIPLRPRAALTDYGRSQSEKTYFSVRELHLRPQEESRVTFEISQLYHMEASGNYKVTVSCRIPGSHGSRPVLSSNQIMIRILRPQ